MPFAIAAAAAAALLTGGTTAGATLPKDLAAAEKAYDAAQLQGDRAALERLLDKDYLLVSSSGAVSGKADFVRDITSPQYKLQPFVVEQPVEKVWPGGAVLGGVVRLRGVDHGQAFDARLRFADIWAKRNGRWTVIYTHVSKAPAP